MALLRHSSLALLAAVCAAIPGCKAHPSSKPKPVTVRIFRNLTSPYAQELDYRILDFEATNPRLPNGSAIYVGNLNVAEAQNALSNMDDPTADIVILASPTDVANFPTVAGEMSHAVNVCAAVLACPGDVPALVPSKIQGERAEAANKFVQFLATRTAQAPAASQTNPAPAPNPAPTPSSH